MLVEIKEFVAKRKEMEQKSVMKKKRKDFF